MNGINQVTIFGATQDRYYMGVALAEARKAYECGEVPVGAIVVDANGDILTQAYNQVEHLGTQRAHAEMIALEHAAQVNKNWRLSGCWLYVTLEPCTMCMGLALLSRLAGVAYGAASPLFGYRLDSTYDLRLYKRNDFTIIEGVETEKSEQLLKQFFYEKRMAKSG